MLHNKTFDGALWIGRNLMYPAANMPKEVLLERRRLLKVPAFVNTVIPYRSVPVRDLLDTKSLPSILEMSSILDHRAMFRSAPPNAPANIYYHISDHPIPPLTLTNTLLDAFGQQWFDGMQSVCHPTNDTLFLPFWVLTYWQRMGLVLQGQKLWCDARTWVLSCAVESEAAELAAREILMIFNRLGWDISLAGAAGGMRSLEWATFLSSQPVLGRFVDAMVGTINEQVSQNSALKRTVSVRELSFSNALRYDMKRWRAYQHDPGFAGLRNTGDALRLGTQQRVLLPMNIEDMHWALFKVDAGRGEIKYGDTLSWSLPAGDTQRLQLWLRQHGIGPYTKSDDLPHGMQLDDFSCAIGMINTARHDIFGDDLFTNTTKFFLRLREFLLIVESHEAAATPPDDLDSDVGYSSDPDTSDVEVDSEECAAVTKFSQPDLLAPSSFPPLPRTILKLRFHSSLPLITAPPESRGPTLKSASSLPLITTHSKSTNHASSRKAVDLRTAPDDRTGGLFQHFSVTSHEVHLASIKIADELWRDDGNARAASAALDELERKNKITFNSRMRKREQRARDKVKPSVNDSLRDVKLPIYNVAEASRPHRAILENAKHGDPDSDSLGPSVGRKRTHLAISALRINWQTPIIWAGVLRATIIAGHQMSPAAIAAEAKKLDPITYKTLTPQVVGRWINRTGPTPVWTDDVLHRVASGNLSSRTACRFSILTPHPEFVAQVCDLLRKLRVAGISLDLARCAGLIEGQMRHSIPHIFDTISKDGTTYKCSISWV
ncbi:hypothetical protein FIBSPDRAFT_1042366 [Athelia psychrophila]|uniref:Ubiquitin-like protease family profile domain-containing protein n=1 Tax=Athelia psychrophila TaxID=1759441 RepID=A0A166MJJ5_9AGAM|nr:hypothetical protein FIBSPDRAFT_1042366 [Fibularhizoctonia sp. CBS 109695]